MVSNNEKKAADKAGLVSILTLGLILAGLLFVCFAAISGQSNELWYKLVLIVWVICYLLLNDMVEPYFSRVFDNMTKQQGKAYICYCLLDTISLVFLALFALNAGQFQEPFHYCALVVFSVLIFPKHSIYRLAVDKKKQKRKYSVENKKREYIDRKDRFESPKLSHDRFADMVQEGYADIKSVDEVGNIKH